MKKTLIVLLFLSLLLSCASCIAEAPSDDPVTTNTESSESPTHESDETELSPDGSASSEDGTDTEAVTEPTLQYPAVIYTVSTLHVTDEDIEIRDDVESMNFGMSQSTDKLDLEKRICQFTDLPAYESRRRGGGVQAHPRPALPRMGGCSDRERYSPRRGHRPLSLGYGGGGFDPKHHGGK